MDWPLSSRKLAAGAVQLKTEGQPDNSQTFLLTKFLARRIATWNQHVGLLFTCKRTNLMH
jgi:hypothetical protein